MQFRIADTFTDSLAKLTAQEQKAVKTTAFDLQMDPSGAGKSFHRIDRAKDPGFWSVRVNRDIRLIVHRTSSSLLLAYVDHHDKAYKWAERRKLERHPTTGAMQFVEIRERVEEIEVVRPILIDGPAEHGKLKLFDNLRKPELMSFGVPPEWIDDVRQATEDSLLDVIKHLPQEAQEALLKLAVGVDWPPVSAERRLHPDGQRDEKRLTELFLLESPFEEPSEFATQEEVETQAFEHPDAQRRFRTLVDTEELERALEFPWEKWAIFLHPEQRRFVSRAYNGPARISGSAGTGKTIVALHRAYHLARRNPGEKVLLTTFSKALANVLKGKLEKLVGGDAAIAASIDVRSITGVGYGLYTEWFGQPNIASRANLQALLVKSAEEVDGHTFSPTFLISEWTDVVDAWQLGDWEAYRDVSRLGRKTRIGGKQRETLWAIFERVRAALEERNLVTWADVFGRVTDHVEKAGAKPYAFAVVDEAQDLGVAEARFLAALGAGRPDSLFFAGDLGQRIFQHPFSWKSLGIDVRGRSHTLRVNYRTSHQIRSQADRLLPSAISDVDGIEENRRGTVSVFNGLPPEIAVHDSAANETKAVGAWITRLIEDGYLPHEIAVFVRSENEIRRARAAVKASGAGGTEMSDRIELEPGSVVFSTMHLAKGLEFRAVAVMACDDEVIPLQDRIETITDESDLEEVYNTERHLLYVACTRARDRLLVSGVDPASEFLDDLNV